MHKMLSILFLAMGCITTAHAEFTIVALAPTQLQRLIELNGSNAAAKRLADSLAKQVEVSLTEHTKKMHTPLTDEKIRQMARSISAAVLAEADKKEGLQARIDAIYEKYISEKDAINAMEFYDSASGKRLIAAIPSINKEISVAVSAITTSSLPVVLKMIDKVILETLKPTDSHSESSTPGK
jgi:hypothetical protein